MTRKEGGDERFSLKRWSQRKLDAAAPEPATPAAAAAPAAQGSVPVPAAPATPAAPSSPPPELPPVESLRFDSDFTVFLRPGVDENLKRAALKQLFRDPRFNVMDGLDTYIDDYTKPDPIPTDVLAGLLRRGFGAGADASRDTAAPDASRPSSAACEEAPAQAQPGSARAAAELEPPASREGASTTEPAERDTQAVPAQSRAAEPPQER